MNRYSERSQLHPAIFSTISTVSPNIAQMFRGMRMYSFLLVKPQCLMHENAGGRWQVVDPIDIAQGCPIQVTREGLEGPESNGRSSNSNFFVSSFSEFELNPSFRYPMMFHFINLTIFRMYLYSVMCMPYTSWNVMHRPPKWWDQAWLKGVLWLRLSVVPSFSKVQST